ncbi:MAG: restriction endonuclease subunit S [Nitrospira sp.]
MLGKIATFEMGQAPPGTECNKDGKGTLFVKAGEFGKLYPEQKEWTTRPLKFGKRGDVFICVVGATAGKLNLGIDCAIGRSVAAIRPNHDIDTRFVYYQLQPFVLKLRSSSSGSAQGVISKQQLHEIPFRLVDLDKQREMVAEIEKQFSRLDEAVALLKRAKTNLKRYKASVLKAAVEGKLTEDWRKQHPDVEPASKLLERTLAERRAKRAQKKDGFLAADGAPPADSPDGWTICSIDQIAECLDAKRVPVNKTERAKRGGSIPYYGANGQVGVIDDYIFDEPLVLVVEDETFTGRTQAFSYLIRGKAWVNNHAHVLRATSALKVNYLNYALAHYPFTPRTTGSTGRRKLTQKGLMTAPFLLPSLAEQNQIVSEVERRLSVIDELEATVEANLTRADRLRQSILSETFSGRLMRQGTKNIPDNVTAFSLAAESPAKYGKDVRTGR